MALSKFVGDEAYKSLLLDAKLETRSYEDVARDWKENSREWFHALIAIEDLPIVFAIPGLHIYAWCRCKVVADDGAEAHHHWHGLVHFTATTRDSWREELFASVLDSLRERIRLRKLNAWTMLLGFTDICLRRSTKGWSTRSRWTSYTTSHTLLTSTD